MEDIVVTVLIVLAAAGLLGWAQTSLQPQERGLVWLAFLAHVFAAVAQVQLTIDVLGGGDMLNYHSIGTGIADKLSEDFAEVGSDLVQTMLHQPVPLPVPAHGMGTATGAMNALSGFIVFFGGRSIYGACAMVGLAAFFASLAMYVTIREELPEASRSRLLIACLLVPSVVFWSSALLKESIALVGLCSMVAGGQLISRRRRFVRGGLAMVLGIGIVAMLKAYILVPFGLAAGAWFYMVAFKKERGFGLKALTALAGSVLAVGLVLGTGALFPQYSVEMLADEAAHHQEVGARYSGAADYQLDDEATGDIDDPDVAQAQAQLVPVALATALFRPLIFEAGNAQMFANTLETTAVLWFTLLAAYRCGFRGFLRRLVDTPLLVFCLVFVVGLGVGIGLATTNLGTLSRYRMPLMPFFAILLLELSARPQPVRASAAVTSAGSPVTA